MENTTTLSLTLPTPLVYSIASLAVLLLASYLVYLTLPEDKDETALTRLRDRLGLKGLHLVPFMAFVTFWGALVTVLGIGLFGMVIEIISHAIPARKDSTAIWDFRFKLIQITALTTVLGAVIALPITVIRLRLTKKQTDAVTESLFNEKINAATAGLYARRQVTEWRRGQSHDFWQDDIVQRCAAIDRLEGLASENNAETPRIARLLSVYVRELSAELPAQTPPRDATPNEFREWARELPKPRSDMEKATQTLGRLHKLALSPLTNGEIDLRGANLQKCDLNGLAFEKALFQGAKLQGANLIEAELQGAYLFSAQLQGADLFRAQLQGADLFEAQLQGADLNGAQLQGADLNGAQLQGADLNGAEFDAETSLTAAGYQGAAVKEVDFTNLPQITEHLQDMFGDASVKLPDGVTKPNHWPDKDLNYDDFHTQWRAWQATLEPGWDEPDD